MPTNKKRIYFVPHERTAQALKRLSATGIGSVAGIVADLVDAQVVHIEGMALLAEKVTSLNEEGIALVRDASKVAAGHVLPELEKVDRAWTDLLEAIEGAHHKAPVQ